MTDDSAKQRRQLEAQVERWTTEAKRLADAGKEAAALELYQRAADQQPSSPWLQHRTAELARNQKAIDVAITYFRRAATAFQTTNFAKRALGPMRLAWVLASEGLPATSGQLPELASELMQLQRRLGFAADATVTFERSNDALRSGGFPEIPLQLLEEMQRQPLPPRSSVPPGLQTPSSGPAGLDEPPPSSVSPPASNVQQRSSGSPPDNKPSSSRGRALARLLGRR